MTAQPHLIPPPETQITRIFISAGHNYFGHAEIGAGANPILELPEVECVANSGLRGDRFFNYKTNYKGQVTFFAEETYNDLCAMFQVWDRDISVFRRNLITVGTDLNQLIGRPFTIQGVTLLGTEESKPTLRAPAVGNSGSLVLSHTQLKKSFLLQKLPSSSCLINRAPCRGIACHPRSLDSCKLYEHTQKNSKIREPISAQPRIHFQVKDRDQNLLFAPDFPADTDALSFHVRGVIKDLERLKLLFELFAETLDELCRIGSAYESELHSPFNHRDRSRAFATRVISCPKFTPGRLIPAFSKFRFQEHAGNSSTAAAARYTGCVRHGRNGSQPIHTAHASPAAA